MVFVRFCRRWAKQHQLSVTACLIVAAAMTVLSAFTGHWPTDPNNYHSYALQAESWLQGRLDLGQDYPWLELAIYEGRYYVSFPPFPSYILLPFALFLRPGVPDGLISLLFTMAGVFAATKLALDAGLKSRDAVFWTVFLYLGTGYLFIGQTPAVWFFAQVLCFNLSVLSVFAANRGRGGISLFCWAAAVGCRPMVLLFFPVLIMILLDRMKEKDGKTSLLRVLREKWYWLAGPVLLGGSYMLLNYLRFGNILEFGHNYLPEFTRAAEGQFSLTYLRNNLPLLFRLPTLSGDGRLLFPTFDTFLFVLADPLSVPILLSAGYAFFHVTPLRRSYALLLPLLAGLYILILCAHRTLGGWQFGNRYLKDILPYLFFGLLYWMPRKNWFLSLSAVLFFFGFSLSMIGTAAALNSWI